MKRIAIAIGAIFAFVLALALSQPAEAKPKTNGFQINNVTGTLPGEVLSPVTSS